MKIFVFVFLIVCYKVSAMGLRNRYGCPSFKWLKDYHSEYDIPLLNIKFPDQQEDDFAVLRKVQGGSSTDQNCFLKGHLMIQKNVSVTVSKGCDLGNSYEIEFDSQRLVYSAFTVQDGLAKPVLQEPLDEGQSLKPDYNVGSTQQPPLEFPFHGYGLRVKAFYDIPFQSKFDALSKPVVETIFEKAQGLFNLPSLTTNITLDLVDVVAINSSNISQYINSSEMVQLSADGNNINALVFFTDDDHGKLKMVTNSGKVCSSNPHEKIAIVEWRNSIVETSKDLAHEIGHLIGMHHDFNWNPKRTKIEIRRSSNGKNCTSGNGIMDYNSDHSVWSACSVQDFLNYFKTVQSSQIGAKFCLKQSTGHSNTIADIVPATDSLDAIAQNKNSSHSKANPSLEDVPHKNPENVEGRGTAPNNLVVYWTPMPQTEHNAPNFKYRIYWKLDRPDEHWKVEDIADWRLKEFVIPNQPTYQRYKIKVVACNEKGEANMPAEEVVGYSGEDVPAESPKIFILRQVIGPNSAIVSWEPVSPESVRGDFKGYKIQTWTEESGEEKFREILMRKDSTQALVQSFKPYATNYARILAFNGAYNGPPSNVIHFNTPEGRPGPVDMLECFPTASSAVQLAWKKPQEANGILTGYRIFYQEVDGTWLGPLFEREPQILKSNTSSAKLAGLKPHSKYRVTIKATTNAGEGLPYYTECNTNP